MAAIVTLNQDSPSVQYLCKKDKRLTKVISMVGPITYTAVGKEMGRIMLPKIPRQADPLKGSEEICPVPSTATRVILPIYIKQDVSSRRWAAAGKPLPLGGKPLNFNKIDCLLRSVQTPQISSLFYCYFLTCQSLHQPQDKILHPLLGQGLDGNPNQISILDNLKIGF